MDRQRIARIYEECFDLVESYFGSIKKYLRDSEDGHVELGVEIADYPLVSDLIFDSLFELGDEIATFWKTNASHVFRYIREKDSLRCLYSGNITPYSLESFVKKSALYIDNVIIPDPIFNLTRPGLVDYMSRYYYLAKLIQHVFNIWKLKKLILHDNVDILFILPISLEAVGREKCVELFGKGETSYCEYFGRATGQKGVSLETISHMLHPVDSLDEFYRIFSDTTLLPPNLRNPTSLNRFLDSFTRGRSSSDRQTIGKHLDTYFKSQFTRVQEHSHFCELTEAEPIYDYEPSWHFFTTVVGGRGIDGAIASALQTEKFDWISQVPLQALVVFREEQDLGYMRSILRNGITDLKAQADEDLSIVSQQLQENFREAFQKQNAEIGDLEKRVKAITHKEIPLTTSGYLAGFIPVLGQVISFFSAGRDVKKSLEEKKEAEGKIEKARSSFINLLLRTEKP